MHGLPCGYTPPNLPKNFAPTMPHCGFASLFLFIDRSGVICQCGPQGKLSGVDVDGYIEQQSEQARTVPTVASEIAQRLLKVGRAEDAWNAINALAETWRDRAPFEWEQTRIEVLEALGRDEDAQAFRWACFEHSLNATHLRECETLAASIEDFGSFETHEAYLARLKSAHGRKTSFWDLVSAA